MNIVFTYGSIIILILSFLICLLNINYFLTIIGKEGYQPTIILFFALFVIHLTLIFIPITIILKSKLININIPKGNKGPRGNRGLPGNQAICDSCGDDLCLRKILFNITNTYNYWRVLNDMEPYPDTYIIKNEYIKNMIIKQCKSDEFQTIIQKFGSNNRKKCPETLKDYKCGIYDYLFKMWTIWTLIILKFKNGYYFLENESQEELDFDGLIEKEDSFQTNDIVKRINEELHFTVLPKDIFPFFLIRNNSTNNIVNVHVNEIELINDISKNTGISWDEMFTTIDNTQDLGLTIGKVIKHETKKNNKIEISYSIDGINNTFFKNSYSSIEVNPSCAVVTP